MATGKYYKLDFTDINRAPATFKTSYRDLAFYIREAFVNHYCESVTISHCSELTDELVDRHVKGVLWQESYNYEVANADAGQGKFVIRSNVRAVAGDVRGLLEKFDAVIVRKI